MVITKRNLSSTYWTLAQEAREAEFNKKKEEWETQAGAKTAKNRAKRQKKKERAKAKTSDKREDGSVDGPNADVSSAPLKKRRLVNGTEVVFRRPGEQEDDEDEEVGPQQEDTPESDHEQPDVPTVAPVVAEAQKITIHDDD
jgi:hypothetical protein